MAIKGGIDVYKDFKSGDVNGGTALSATGAIAGAGGAAAIMALGASNPVGWALLAVGGLALVAREAYVTANSYKEAGKIVEREWNNAALELNKEVRQREKAILKAEDYLKTESDTEKARQTLLQSGMLSEKDTQLAQKASREQLIKLTEQYKISTMDFSKAGNELINELKGKQVGNANESVKSIQDWINGEASRNYNGTNEALLADLRATMVAKIESKGDSANRAEKEYLKRVNSNKQKGRNGQADMLWELQAWNDGYRAVATSLSGEDLESFTQYANQKGVGAIKRYNYISADEATNAAQTLAYAQSEAEVKSAIAMFKELGFDNLDSLPISTREQLKAKMEKYKIQSYRTGLNNVPYDNYIANLHAGEAVLTASTASELRNLIAEYRMMSIQYVNFEAIIQTQTATLVDKMDDIISNMNSSGVTSLDSWQKTRSKLQDKLRKVQSSKSFG